MPETGAHQPHTHNFLGASQEKNERRTLLVICLTAVTMVLEIVSGLIFNSMALLADGWHMMSHACALGISWVAYLAARRHAQDPRFSFGTGKVSDLAGFASALLLGLIALFMAYESLARLLNPVAISYNQAILVAVIGLLVNVASALILREDHPPGQGQGHFHGQDLNLRSAHLHVLADALTSVLAIVALTAGKYAGGAFLDPVMGLVGAAVISRWSFGLLKETGQILLDMNSGGEQARRLREILEEEPGVKLLDLHIWRLGPGHFGAIVSLIAEDPAPPEHYKARLAALAGLSHLTVEVHRAGRGTGRDAAVSTSLEY